MTISSFLEPCQTYDTRLRIIKRGKGRVYDGDIKDFKTGEENKEAKSRLASEEIFSLSFDALVAPEKGWINVDPLVIIVI